MYVHIPVRSVWSKGFKGKTLHPEIGWILEANPGQGQNARYPGCEGNLYMPSTSSRTESSEKAPPFGVANVDVLFMELQQTVALLV